MKTNDPMLVDLARLDPVTVGSPAPQFDSAEEERAFYAEQTARLEALNAAMKPVRSCSKCHRPLEAKERGMCGWCGQGEAIKAAEREGKSLRGSL